MPSPEAISVPVANGVICCAAVEGEPCAGSTESWQDTGGATNCSRREHLKCLASVTAVFLLNSSLFHTPTQTGASGEYQLEGGAS